MSMLLLLLMCACAHTVIGQPHVVYLKGVERLNMNGYIDYYFCCNLTGDFIQWEYNYEPLRGFHIEDAGLVVVIPRSTYEFTATLLSSQLDPETNQRRLDSVLVLSFNGDHPSSFEVTCSSNSDFDTTRVNGLRGSITSRNSSNNEVALDHIVSAEIVQNKSNTHIFMCGAENSQQFYEIQHHLPIIFTEHDDVGQARTALSEDSNYVSTQGVLIARLPYQRTSLLFITENADVTVTCYFGTHQVVLSSDEVANVESTGPLPTSTHTAPVTTTTSGTLVPHSTMMLSSTTYRYYETDDTVFVGSSDIVAVNVGASVGVLISVLILTTVAVSVVIKKKMNRKISSGSSLPFKMQDMPIKADSEAMDLGGGKSKQKCSYESASLSGHACQIPMEESNSEEASFRVCESSTYHFGHKYGGTVTSFVSLQEPSFIGADELWQDNWNASASENVCPVFLPPTTDSYSLKSTESQEDPDVAAAVAVGNILKMVCVHSKDDNGNVAKENVHIANDTQDKVGVTEEERDAHDDVNNVGVTNEDKDAHDDTNDVDITDEDKDAHDDANDVDITDKDKYAHDDANDVDITDKDKNAHSDVDVTDEDKGAHDNANDVDVTDEDKDVHDNVHITHNICVTDNSHDHVLVMDEHKDAQSDKRATAKENGAQCEEKSNYRIHRQISCLEQSLECLKITICWSRCSFSLFPPPPPWQYFFEKEICPEVDLMKKIDLTKLETVTPANKPMAWDVIKLGCGFGCTSLKHSDDGSMDVKGDIYRASTISTRNTFWSMSSLSMKKQLVHPEIWRKKITSLISRKEGPCGGIGAVNGKQINSFVHCFLPITISGADLKIFKSITDALHIIQLVFRVIQMLCVTLYFQVLLCFYILASEVSRVPLVEGHYMSP